MKAILTERDRQVVAMFDEIIVSFSAGKDSLACLRWALETGKRVRAVLADTGNEPPETPDYILTVESTLGVRIETYQRPEHTFSAIVRRRGMWPIPGSCLISSTVKRDDFAWYLKQTWTPENALIVLGQRRSESASRAVLPDFSPMTRSGSPAYRPILDWSIDDVFSFLSREGLRAHPAYAKGRKRVGCVWCVNSAHDDLVRDEQLYPARCAELRALRAEIGLPSTPAGISQGMLLDEWTVCRYEAVHCE
jgi:3'-phosphoadenosine 5'-phosphosulfate sulfotransferase (PAPS reductase)/FAD synthetase